MKIKILSAIILFSMLWSCKCLFDQKISITENNSISVYELRLLYKSYLESKITNGFETQQLKSDAVLLSLKHNTYKEEYSKIDNLICESKEELCESTSCDENSSEFECINDKLKLMVRAPGVCERGSCHGIRLPDYIILGLWKNKNNSAIVKVMPNNDTFSTSTITLNKNSNLKSNLSDGLVQRLTVTEGVSYNINVMEQIGDETYDYTIKNVEFSK